MRIDTTDIRNEFNELSSVDMMGENHISAVYDHLSVSNGKGSSKGRLFNTVKLGSSKAFGMKDIIGIKDFSLALKEHGNFEAARSMVNIGRKKALKIVGVLNCAADKKGIEPIFIHANRERCNRKLHEKQVSYIKYLVTKYSNEKVAGIYDIAVSTVNDIANNRIWKDVAPAIINSKPIRYINKEISIPYVVKTEEKITLPFENNKDSENIFYEALEKSNPTCPHCKHNEIWKFSDGKRYSCKKCKKQFTILIGTPFESSKVPAYKWLNAFYLFNKDNKMSAHLLQKNIEVSYTTCVQMKKRIKLSYYTPFFNNFIELINIL